MLRKILLPTILIILAYGFWLSPDFKEIAAGVSIFLFGIIPLEKGFKAFFCGGLEKVLRKSTDKLYKSIGFGVLVSVLTISFLGAGLIGLAQGMGIVFGANIGTTTSAWLVTGLIAIIFMPQIMFSVDFVSEFVGIRNDDYTLKLAVFHTIFNIIGVLVMIPFIGKLVILLESTLKSKDKSNHKSVDNTKYLNDSVLMFPSTQWHQLKEKHIIIKKY